MRVKSHKRNTELAKRRGTWQSRGKMNKTMFPLVTNLVGLKTGNLSIAVMHATTVTPSPGSVIVFSVNISSICCILLKKLTFKNKWEICKELCGLVARVATLPDILLETYIYNVCFQKAFFQSLSKVPWGLLSIGTAFKLWCTLICSLFCCLCKEVKHVNN